MSYKKEGFAQGAVGSIVVMITGIGIAVLTLIFVGVLGGQTYNMVESDINEIGNASALYEQINVSDSVTRTLAHPFIHQNSLVAANVTGATDILIGNFTVDYSAGTVLLNNGAFNNSLVNFSYDYGAVEIQTSVKNGIISGFEALEQTGDYLPIIVLAVVITLVMAMVLGLGGLGGGMRGSAL